MCIRDSSNPVPAPLGTTGFLNSAHARTIFSTSRVVFTCTTASMRSPPPLSPCMLPISLLHDSKNSPVVCTLDDASSSSSSSVSASRNRSRKNSFSSNSSFLDDDDDDDDDVTRILYDETYSLSLCSAKLFFVEVFGGERFSSNSSFLDDDDALILKNETYLNSLFRVLRRCFS